MSALRVVQVGLGPHGRNWAAHVVPAIEEVDLVGYVDTDPNALDALRGMTGAPAGMCFESLREAIAATRPEAALVTTAVLAHAPVVEAALESGLHVMVEKPFADTLGAARELVELAAAKGLVLMVSQNYRHWAAPRAIASLVAESELGEVHEVSIDFRRYSTAGPNGPGRHHLEEQPLLVDMSIHHFDLLRMILNREPRRIYCEAWNPAWTDFSGPSAAVASIVFDGVVVGYRGSWISAGPVTPWAGDWTMDFEHGEVFWTSPDGDASHETVTIRPRGGDAHNLILPDMRRTGGAGTLTEFAGAVRTGRDPETSGRNNLGTIALMEAAVESAKRRSPVAIARNEEALAI